MNSLENIPTQLPSQGGNPQDTSRPIGQHEHSPIRFFVILLSSIFMIELVIMAIFLVLPPISPIAEVIIDAASLTLFVSPILYRFAFLPLYGQITKFKQSIETQKHLSQTLEQRVTERTIEFEKKSRRLETVSRVARSIAAVQDLDILLPAITQLISEQFGYYHVGIFLVDQNKEFAALRAANSEGGQRMLNRQHRLPLNTGSIVGYVTSRGEPRIALDVGADAVYFKNPDLPTTRSEMALPLRVGDQIIGALDVQSDQTNAFKEEDITILTTLADQVAIAIENARLFSETRKALMESQAAFELYVKLEWSSFARQVKHIGYIFDGKHITPLDPKARRVQTKPFTQTGQPAFEKTDEVLVIPIKLRNETIGVLNVRAKNGQRQWTQTEIALLEASAERTALALENARLAESAQRRAGRERAIVEISNRIGAHNDMDAILQTAVEELGRKFGGATEVSLEIGGNEVGNED